MASLPDKMQILLILAKTLATQKLNFSRIQLFHIKTRVSLKYIVNDCRIAYNKTASKNLLNSTMTTTGA